MNKFILSAAVFLSFVSAASAGKVTYTVDNPKNKIESLILYMDQAGGDIHYREDIKVTGTHPLEGEFKAIKYSRVYIGGYFKIGKESKESWATCVTADGQPVKVDFFKENTNLELTISYDKNAGSLSCKGEIK